MRNGETGPICSSEQLESVRQLVGPNEPALFTVLQQLTKEYDEITTIHLTKEFCFLCQTDENKRVGMEYLYMNGLLDEVQELVKVNEESDNLVNREWAYLYQFFLDRKLRNAEITDIDSFVSKFQSSDPELECLVIFTVFYAHCDKLDFAYTKEHRNELTQKMLEVKSTLLRLYFQYRENEMLFVIHWRNNEVEMARHYGENLLENTLINYEKKCYVLANLAETYIYDDFNMAIKYMDEAVDIAEEYNLTYYLSLFKKEIIPFIHAVNGKCEGIETTDIPEAAHLAVMSGDKERAIELLSELDDLSPFQLYYLGLAKDNEKLLYESYRRIIDEIGDYFFGRLPLRELQKRGWDSVEEKTYNIN